MLEIDTHQDFSIGWVNLWVHPSEAYIMFLDGLCKEHKERSNTNDELESEL